MLSLRYLGYFSVLLEGYVIFGEYIADTMFYNGMKLFNIYGEELHYNT